MVEIQKFWNGMEMVYTWQQDIVATILPSTDSIAWTLRTRSVNMNSDSTPYIWKWNVCNFNKVMDILRMRFIGRLRTM